MATGLVNLKCRLCAIQNHRHGALRTTSCSEQCYRLRCNPLSVARQVHGLDEFVTGTLLMPTETIGEAARLPLVRRCCGGVDAPAGFDEGLVNVGSVGARE